MYITTTKAGVQPSSAGTLTCRESVQTESLLVIVIVIVIVTVIVIVIVRVIVVIIPPAAC